MSLLEVAGVDGGYGEVQVLRDVSLRLDEGRLVTLLGANGVGKTTLARAITGLVRTSRGTVTFDGTDVTGMSTHARAARGLTLVPEGRELFSDMTVQENLEMGATVPRARRRVAENRELVFSMFPVLADRPAQKAGTMSGGEQQMLAIARGLMAGPRLLVVDELSLGLAPKLVTQLMGAVGELKRQGQTMLLTEQNVQAALALSDYAYVLAEGRVVTEGTPDQVGNEDEVRRTYLGM